MPIPVKVCVGQFSDETVRVIQENLDRAQWQPHRCERCGQKVEARLVKGHWSPDPHWPSIARRHKGKLPVPKSRSRQELATGGGSPPLPDTLPDGAIAETATSDALTVSVKLAAGKKSPAKTRTPTEDSILKRVFIVDDEFIITSTLALILRHHGFDATSFTQPLEALQAVKERAPDVLVSDIMMPEFSGIDLAIRVQQQCPECKILLFSGQAYTNALLEKAKTDGHHFEVLLKPVHPVELMRRIHEVLRDAPPPLVANEV
jgi:CheY-like chemotaxis protein